MRRRCFYAFLTIMALGFAQQLSAQYYTWGSDPASLRWRSIPTPDVRVIYPDTVSGVAHRTLFYINTVRPSIDYGFRYGPMRIPFVMHPENFRSNGLVMWLPKRIEFLTTPAVDGYSMPWIKQLVAHEYRHAVQYNNINQGVIRVASWILGQQGSTVGLLFMPLWMLEGDAVMSETSMSSFGRGLQPRFTLEYRAMGNFSQKRRNSDVWFCGSYRHMVPDQYQLGYQMCAYAYDRFGEVIWDKMAWYSARNPYMILPHVVALKKFYHTGSGKLFCETFADLHAYWSSLPPVADTSCPLTPLPEKNYTTYQWPQALSDTTVLALKTDYDRPSRLVRINTRTGCEELFCHTGALSTRPAVADGRVWWTEYRRSLLFEQRVNSQLCYAELADGRPRVVREQRNALYATPVDAGRIAWVEYNPDGRYWVVMQGGESVERYATPLYAEIHGLAWDEVSQALYVIVTDDSGMWIGRIDAEGLHPVTTAAYITLSDLRAQGGRLYYGSIASGRDEVHCYDLAEGREYQLTTSAYGSFSPAAAGRDVWMTTYGPRGYHVARQADSAWIALEPRHLPINVLNPPRRHWDVINLDTVRFTQADSAQLTRKHPSRRYRKGANLINVHSWLPIQTNPFHLIEEQSAEVNLGVTLISQNLLSNAEGFVAYGWNHREGSLVRGALRYFGLGVDFRIEGAYGGQQMIYTLPVDASAYPEAPPAPGRYYSVGASASLPLYIQRGYHTRQLSVMAGWNYSNGLVADLDALHFDQGGQLTGVGPVTYHSGLHKLSFSVGFSDAVRSAHRDFITPWGYTLNAGYTLNPSNKDFSSLVSCYGRVYTPGFFAHNSLSLAAAYQTSVGGYRLPDGRPVLGYKSTRLLPRGVPSTSMASDNYMALSLDYQFPLCYPEGGISSVLYFKRIRLNLGGDYAQFRSALGRQHRLWSYGGDLIFDINILRQPSSATSSIKFSFYMPSEGGFWFSAGLGLPF